ncbi:MAG: apolipoprotein N-acyltransferase [Flavobacteriales bacterium]|nr:apolipoprotein N-acyltransferase [Flavobacteriales bacterium]
MLKNFKHPLYKAIATGFLLTLSWPATGSITPFIFIAFVPLLLLEERFFSTNRSGFIRYAFLAFLIWNVGSTYFIFCVEEPFATKFTASAITYFLNSLFMALAFWLFHQTKKKIGVKQGYIGLIMYWMSFEYLHYHWDINWPWLNLGNVFSERITWIQWYEYTGVQGGTLWVLIINLLVFQLIRQWNINRRALLSLSACALVFPILVSLFLFHSEEANEGAVNIVLVQPNIDPYDEKFDTDPKEQLERMLLLAEEKITEETDFVIFPETALQERGLWEHQFQHSYSHGRLNEFLEKHQEIELIIGASIIKYYGKEKATYTARFHKADEFYYDAFNTAIHFSDPNEFEMYHKSKLVPGTEKMPFAKYLGFLEELAWDLGGTSGSLGKQKEREVFVDDSVKIAPLICYESVFGEYVTDYIKQGGNMLCIITNDGWWQDSPGFKQHLQYASLRAIENRKAIARSANTGVSAFIDEKGRIYSKTEFWEPAVVSGSLPINNELTLYAEYGDFITRPMLMVAALLIAWTFFKPNKRTIKENRS